MEWGATWNSLGSVIAQASALKENLEKQLDEAVGVNEGDKNEDAENDDVKEAGGQQEVEEQQQHGDREHAEQDAREDAREILAETDPEARNAEDTRGAGTADHEDISSVAAAAAAKDHRVEDDTNADAVTSDASGGDPNEATGMTQDQNGSLDMSADAPSGTASDGWGADGDDDDLEGLESEPETAESPTETPAERSAEIPAETPAEITPPETNTEASPAASPAAAETPAEVSSETPSEGFAEKPAEGSAETPSEGSTETPAEGPTESPAGGSTETPAEGYAVVGADGPTDDLVSSQGNAQQDDSENAAPPAPHDGSAEASSRDDNDTQIEAIDVAPAPEVENSLRVSGEDPSLASNAMDDTPNEWDEELNVDLDEGPVEDSEPAPEDGNEAENGGPGFANTSTSGPGTFLVSPNPGPGAAPSTDTGEDHLAVNNTVTQEGEEGEEGPSANEERPPVAETEETSPAVDIAPETAAAEEGLGAGAQAAGPDAADAEGLTEGMTPELAPAAAHQQGDDTSNSEELAAQHTAEIAELRRVLEAREKQLESTMEQSAGMVAENTALQEEVEAVKAQLREAQELAQRQEVLAQGKQSNQRALQDALRKAEQRARNAEDKMKEAVSKHEALMQEGMGLSKRLGTVEQTVRKLREEKRALEAECSKLRDKLAQSEESIKALRAAQQAAEERHKQESASMSAMTSSSAEAARKLSEAHAKAQELEARIAQLSGTLDEAYKEVAEQKRETAAVKQDLNASRVEQEKLRHQLKEQISSTQVRNDVASVMEKNVADMQKALEEQGSQQSMTEELLRAEIKSLKKQLGLAEKRNEDLVSGSAKATRPLLRQIEALENANQAQRNSYEAAHSSIMARLLAAEQAESAARAAKHEAETARSNLHLELADLQATLDGTLAEKKRVEAQRQSAKDRLAAAEREIAALSAQLEAAGEHQNERIAEFKAAEAKLRRAMAMAEERHEQEVSEVTRLHEEARDRLERKLAELESRARTSRLVHRTTSSRTAADFHGAAQGLGVGAATSSSYGGDDALSAAAESVASGAVSTGPQTQEDILAELNIGFAKSGDGDAAGAAAAGAPPMLFVQQLRAQVHQKQGQIESLMEQVGSIERTRDALSEELVRVTERAQQASTLSRELEAARGQLAQKTQQHEVLLEMFGETQEELDELRTEQETMRQSFRRQLEALAAAESS